MSPGSFILFSCVISHYAIDQSMIIICDMRKMLGGETKQMQSLGILPYRLCYPPIEVKHSNKINIWPLLPLK